MNAVVTIELEEATALALEAYAKQIHQPRDSLLKQAVEEWLAVQKWQLEEIEAGIAEADRGEFVSDEDLERIMAKHRTS